MKKLFLLGVLVTAMCSHVFGFATVYQSVKGGDVVGFSTNVEGVSVYMNGQKVGLTNNKFFSYTFQTRDGEDKVLTFKKAGYKDASVTVGTTFDSVFWGNLIVFGSIGSSVDSITTQNVRKYSPNQFFVELKKN